MSIDWSEEQERDVLRLYVQEGKTAEETVQWLARQHGIKISLRQFKHKFRNLKNLNAHEWQEVAKEIRKREDQGKASDVYICGERKKPGQIKRSIRHSSTRNGLSGAGIDWNAKIYNHRRVEIRTPEPHNDGLNVPEISESFPSTREDCEISANPETEFCVQASAPIADLPIDMDGIEIDWNTPKLDHHFPIDDFHLEAHLPLVEADSTQKDCLISFPEPTTGSITMAAMPISSFNSPISLHRNLNFSTFSSPKFLSASSQTLEIVHQTGQSCMSPWASLNNISDHEFSLVPRRLDTFNLVPGVSMIDWGKSHKTVPLGQPGWVESQLMSLDLEIKLEKSTTDSLEGILSENWNKHIHSRNNTQDSLNEMFLVVTHLVVNKLLVGVPLFNFIQWILDRGYTSHLYRFLQTKLSRTAELIHQVLVTIADEAAFKWGRMLDGYEHEKNFLVKHPIEVLSLIQAADTRSITCFLGGRLLIHVVRCNNLDAAKLLVDRGANVDFLNEEHLLNPFDEPSSISSTMAERITPLGCAVDGGSIEMLRYLLRRNADINLRFSNVDMEMTALTACIKTRNIEMVNILLESGAEIFDDLRIRELDVLTYARGTSLMIYQLLETHLDAAYDSEKKNLLPLLRAAERGNNALSQFIYKKGGVQQDILEAALCRAVELGNVGALRTLLHRGVDPNAALYLKTQRQDDSDTNSDEFSENNVDVDSPAHEAALSETDYDEDSDKFSEADSPMYRAALSHKSSAPDMTYLLAKAGATLDEETVLEICHDAKIDELISMVRADYNVAVVGPCVLASNGIGIAECGALLDLGININAYSAKGSSPLQVVAFGNRNARNGGHLALVQYLLERGADVNLPARDDANPYMYGKIRGGLTAIQAAALSGNPDVVDCLLEAGANVNTPPTERGITVLEASAEAICGQDSKFSIEERTRTFKKLVAYGAPVNRTDGRGCQVLHQLIEASQHQLLVEMLEAGANIEDQIRYLRHELRPMQVAAAKHDVEAMELLLSYNANINAPASEAGLTALQAAIDLDQPFREGCSSYYETHGTSKNDERWKAISFLLQNGADVNAPAARDYGRTALQAAVSNDPPDHRIIGLLLEHGADINAPPADTGGVTALQGAALAKDIQLVKMLLAHGADINAPAADDQGRTAIEAAAEHGSLAVVRLLLNKGADPNLNHGFSRAIEFAEENCHFEIADILKERVELHPCLLTLN